MFLCQAHAHDCQLFDKNQHSLLLLDSCAKSCFISRGEFQETSNSLRIDHSHIVSIRPGWAHSQRRVGVNITIPLH